MYMMQANVFNVLLAVNGIALCLGCVIEVGHALDRTTWKNGTEGCVVRASLVVA